MLQDNSWPAAGARFPVSEKASKDKITMSGQREMTRGRDEKIHGNEGSSWEADLVRFDNATLSSSVDGG